MNVLKTAILLACILYGGTSSAQDKIQQAVDAIKAAHYSENDDYHTDGQRTVWVKSYKRWTLDDLVMMKKEDPNVLLFLDKAAEHNRLDVLSQLLPDYYSSIGKEGVQKFAADIKQVVGSAKPAGQ